MPKDKKKRDKAKPYTKDGQNESDNHDSSEEPASCCVCEAVMKDTTPDGQLGDEVVYCEGGCTAWFHRKCAGLSKSAYKLAGESELPFYCVFCIQSVYKKEISDLKDQICTLTSKISQLLESLQGQKAPSEILPTKVTSGGQALQSNPTISRASPTVHPPKQNATSADDRKYNLVVYGVKECSKGTNRFTRMKLEFEQVAEILGSVDKSIGPQSIRDSFRLGKYNESSERPRPILIKLNRSYDVSNILSAKQNLPKGLTIKPDLSPAERAVESLLMKERWQLIQSGQNRKDIKIQGKKILLKGKLFGAVTDSKFVKNVIHPTRADSPTDNSPLMDTVPPDN